MLLCAGSRAIPATISDCLDESVCDPTIVLGNQFAWRRTGIDGIRRSLFLCGRDGGIRSGCSVHRTGSRMGALNDGSSSLSER
jgi:hypothetical protein